MDSYSFGYWMERRRKALDLTRAELAQQVGCALETIKKIERDERRPSRQIAFLLAAALAVSDGERERFLAAARGLRPADQLSMEAEPIPAQPASLHNLPPQPTPFIGREQELADISALLANRDCRLLTLIGPGGIGKSRIAIQAVANQLNAFPHGVYLVALAGAQSASSLPSAIAAAIGVELQGQTEPQVQLLNYLRDKALLLLLDSFEHLLEGAGLVTKILESAGQVKILVTSRERLNVQSEWVLPIDGLSYPETDRFAEVDRYGAIALFTQSAQRLQANFSLNEAEWPCVAHICRMVEGMPLAIELASSWTRLLSCEDIAAEIEKSVGFLAATTRDMPERHRSMQAVFDHSWELLSEEEKTIVRRLSVFRGGFTRLAAGEVTGASIAVLASLLDKSLLRISSHFRESQRYDMHDLVRQYAGEQLERAGELETVRDRHLEYFVHEAESADRVVHTGEYLSWLLELETEIDNLRAALSWGLVTPQGSEAGLRLVGELGWFWYLANHWHEGRNWVERALAIPESAHFPAAKAQATFTAGGLAILLDDYDIGEPKLHESIDLFEQENDLRGLAFTYCVLASARLNQSDYPTAQNLEEKSISLFQSIQDKPGLQFALGILGDVLLYQGDYEQAKGKYNDSLELSQALGNPGGIAYALFNLGEIARREGNLDAAQEYLTQALELARSMGIQRFQAMALFNLGRLDKNKGQRQQSWQDVCNSTQLFLGLGDTMGMAGCLEELAVDAAEQNQPERAIQIFAAATTLRETIHVPPPLVDRAALTETLERLRAKLSPEQFASAWAAGQAMTLQQAIAYALREMGG